MKYAVLYIGIICLTILGCRKDPSLEAALKNNEPHFNPSKHMATYIGSWTSHTSYYSWRISEGASWSEGYDSSAVWAHVNYFKEDTALITPASSFHWICDDEYDGGVVNIDSLFQGFSGTCGPGNSYSNYHIQIKGPNQDSLIIHLELGYYDSDGLNYENSELETRDYLLLKVE
jgi:hypothetical protein